MKPTILVYDTQTTLVPNDDYTTETNYVCTEKCITAIEIPGGVPRVFTGQHLHEFGNAAIVCDTIVSFGGTYNHDDDRIIGWHAPHYDILRCMFISMGLDPDDCYDENIPDVNLLNTLGVANGFSSVICLSAVDHNSDSAIDYSIRLAHMKSKLIERIMQEGCLLDPYNKNKCYTFLE